MVHAKYKWKNGKRYGPYYYHNKRVGGKVVTTYLGKNHKSKKDRDDLYNGLKLFGVVLAIVFAVFIVGELDQRFLLSPIEVQTLVVDFGSGSLEEGEIISGNVLLSLRAGELIPAGALLVVVWS